MSSNAALTELFAVKKLFKWTIPNFNEFDATNMKRDTNRFGTTYFVESPLLTAVNPYDGKQYTTTIKLNSTDIHQNFTIVSPSLCRFMNGDATFRFYFTTNDESKVTLILPFTLFPWSDDIKKLTIFADLLVHRNIYVPAFARKPQNNLATRFTEIWKNDSSVKFTIKCGKTSTETFKPFLAANSCFFKDMFESTIQNFVEIDDFEAEVVQKMIEFCETDDIKEVNGHECELFKFAHKYQIPDLMEFAVEKMSENANTSNIFGYLQLSINYGLKDFEEWCMQFAFPANSQ